MTLATQLRNTTQRAHDSLVHSETGSLLMQQPSRETLGTALQRYYGMHAVLEEHICHSQDWPLLPLPYAPSQRLQLLAQDLQDLGTDIASIEMPPWPQPSVAMLPGWGLGALYVLEGSRMGARHIGQHLAQHLPHVRCQFFEPNPNETEIVWNNIMKKLEEVESDSTVAQQVLASAQDTYHLISTWL